MKALYLVYCAAAMASTTCATAAQGQVVVTIVGGIGVRSGPAVAKVSIFDGRRWIPDDSPCAGNAGRPCVYLASTDQVEAAKAEQSTLIAQLRSDLLAAVARPQESTAYSFQAQIDGLRTEVAALRRELDALRSQPGRARR